MPARFLLAKVIIVTNWSISRRIWNIARCWRIESKNCLFTSQTKR